MLKKNQTKKQKTVIFSLTVSTSYSRAGIGKHLSGLSATLISTQRIQASELKSALSFKKEKRLNAFSLPVTENTTGYMT